MITFIITYMVERLNIRVPDEAMNTLFKSEIAIYAGIVVVVFFMSYTR